jgi:hypothetical protein
MRNETAPVELSYCEKSIVVGGGNYEGTPE